jgi:hypothetical protein
MGGGFGSPNLHGAVAHLDSKGKKRMTPFGSYPNRAIIIDGVFMAIKRKYFKRLDLMNLALQNGIFMI